MESAWKAALTVVERLESAGYEAVIVGGAVRDTVMQRPFSDVDVATQALPEQVKSIFERTVDVGIQHGTVLVLDAGEPIEVTTYRTESGYSDHRRPDAVTFVRNLREDMKRRDFTMNAMAMRANGEIVDYFGGGKDISRGLIRAVGDAEERFQEDALRMLRAIRFMAQLGFELEDATFAAIRKHAGLLEHIAVERIVQELDKVFVSRDVWRAFLAIEASGLSKWLKGNFDSHPWISVRTDNADVGWAYFYWLSEDENLLSYYKSSNARKHFVKRVNELIALKVEAWSPNVLFDYSLVELESARLVKEWTGQPTLSEEKIRSMKETLPIQSMQELAVSGKEILAWNEAKRGPWMKEHIEAIKQAVLTSEVVNDYDAIKEWYDAKFNKG